MSHYLLMDGEPGTGFDPVGAALELWQYRGREVIISGPAETGKTYAACQKLDALLWKYAGSQAVLVRKVRDTVYGSVMQTLRRIQGGNDSPVRAYGGEKPEWLQYPNGSRLWVAGMDNPGKALSSERDFILVNQAEELTLNDWEVLTTRATGRAGNAPYPQVMGDCNPGPPHHWIKQRQSLKLLESRHEDNPTLFNRSTGQWTAQGLRTREALEALTGVLYERLCKGRWVSAEGAVYLFDARVHLIDRFPIPLEWPRIRSFDFGFTNPFVCLWGALDHDGRLHVYREVYMTQRTVRVHAQQVNELSGVERFEASVADHDAEDRATLDENGIPTYPATKALLPGINAVTERLKVQGNGKPRLFLHRGLLVERDETLAAQRRPVSVEQEFDVYAWPKAVDGKPVKDKPVDKDNHGLDALRYLVMWADERERTIGGGPVGVPQPDAGEWYRHSYSGGIPPGYMGRG